jgi:hypothetical protein
MFRTVATPQNEFKDINRLYEELKNENDTISRIPVADFLDKGATFYDDAFYGVKGTNDKNKNLMFTKDGLQSLCQCIKFPYSSLQKTIGLGVSSHILNDFFKQEIITKTLNNYEFVVRNISPSHGDVCGLVSHTYAGYSNLKLLDDIDRIIPLLNGKNNDEFKLHIAYLSNTKFNLRLTSRHFAGVLKDEILDFEDKTEIGLQFDNSMIGDKAVSISYFLLRLVCSNGLTVPTGRSSSKVIHSGLIGNFPGRLESAYKSVMSKIEEMVYFIKEIGSIGFSPEKLAYNNFGKLIFNIIPKSKQDIIRKNRDNFDDKLTGKLTLEQVKRQDEIAIELIPGYYASKESQRVFQSQSLKNASVYDFINIFTEYAQKKKPEERVEIEKKAGILASEIIKNKKLLH